MMGQKKRGPPILSPYFLFFDFIKAEGDDGVDYAKLIERFGSSPISQELLDRCEKLTGKPVHRFLRRGIFFSHREFEQILGTLKKSKISVFLNRNFKIFMKRKNPFTFIRAAVHHRPLCIWVIWFLLL